MSQQTATAPTQQTRTRSWIRFGASAALALVANLIIYLVGNALLDGSIQVANPSTGVIESLPLSALVAASIVPVALGVGFLAAAERFWRLTPALVIVGALTLLSLGAVFSLDVSTGSKMALTIMHLATGSAVIGPALWTSK